MKKTIISFLSIIVLVSTILLGIYAINPEEEMMVHGQGNKAPDFTVVDIYDNSFTLSDHSGEVILMNFMSVPCKASHLVMKELNIVYEQVGNEIVMISIDVLQEDTKEDIELTYGEYVNKWIFAFDTDDMISKYEVYTIPYTCIIDTNGNISFRNFGLIYNETLLEEIDKASATDDVQDSTPIFWFGIIGLIIVIILILTYFLYSKKERTQKPLDNFSGAQQQYPCLTCGQPLTYIMEYQKWYCYTCKKYV